MILKFLIVADVAFLFIASTSELLEGWGKLGTIATLSALLLVLLLKTFPAIAKENKEAAETLAKSINDMSEKIDNGNERTIELLQNFLTNDKK